MPGVDPKKNPYDRLGFGQANADERHHGPWNGAFVAVFHGAIMRLPLALPRPAIGRDRATHQNLRG